jgi:antitoxin component HigA of HigAB toxin-antitoxin module
MSIRQIAIDLYRQEKEISRLKKELAQATPDKIESIQEKINQAGLERTMLKNMLEAKKKS